MNVGYIFVDGCEMKYVLSDKFEDFLILYDFVFIIDGSFEEKIWESLLKFSFVYVL